MRSSVFSYKNNNNKKKKNIYIYIHTHIHTHTHIYIYIYIYVCIAVNSTRNDIYSYSVHVKRFLIEVVRKVLSKL